MADVYAGRWVVMRPHNVYFVNLVFQVRGIHSSYARSTCMLFLYP